MAGFEVITYGRFWVIAEAKSYQVKRRFTQIDANGMYLHVDDPPCQKLPLRSPWLLQRDQATDHLISRLVVSNASITTRAFDRHRGGSCLPTPATPPCIRVRTRRFEKLR